MMLHAPARIALQDLKNETGKAFNLRTIYSFRYMERKRPVSGRSEVELIFACLEECALKFPGIRYEVLCLKKVSASGSDELVTITSRGINGARSEKADMQCDFTIDSIHILVPGGHLMALNFGEVLFLDGTYNTNRHGLPLIAISVEDGFGCTRIVQVSLVVSESANAIRSALSFYKKHSGNFTPHTIMIDKDCTERTAIVSVFPHANILLYHFHVIKYLGEKLSEGSSKTASLQCKKREDVFFVNVYIISELSFTINWNHLFSDP